MSKLVRYTHDSLTLWYGTSDTPAPSEVSPQARRGLTLVVAVQPVHPNNVVAVHYRIDGGALQVVRGARCGTDSASNVEYHRVSFPVLWAGKRVSYVPVLTRLGGRAPASDVIAALPSSFCLEDDSPSAIVPLRKVPVASPESDHRVTTEYLATIEIPLNKPETIGETPEGLRVNWFWSPAEGTVAGPKLRGKVRHIGGDWMTIRHDGIGVMDVRATIETHDGALVYADYQGYYDLGENGYQAFLNGKMPARAPTRTTPRLHTAHPSYRWLNRVQCIGIGAVHVSEQPFYIYDLHALR